MYTFITILIMLVSALLILVVLIQKPKGGGLAANFSSPNQVMGVKRTTDVVEKTTWALAIALFTFALFINFFIPREENNQLQDSSVRERIQSIPSETPALPSDPAASESEPSSATQPE